MKAVLSVLIAIPVFLAYPVALLCEALHISTDWFVNFVDWCQKIIDYLYHIEEE